MRRETAMYEILPGRAGALESGISYIRDELNTLLVKVGAKNASVWTAADFLYLYAEFEDGCPASLESVTAPYAGYLTSFASKIAGNEMDLMYHDLGIVRQDKTEIRRRVFATVLKPGCAAEYKTRHQKLIEARGEVTDHHESNFTIRCAKGKYIFGYCEFVKLFDREETEEEKQATIAWETRQLEIMDWLTDDVDWITGQKHEKMRCLFLQKGY